MPPGPARIKINRSYTYGWVYGGGGGALAGTLSDWRAYRGAAVGMPMTELLTSSGQVLKYFDSDHAAFNADPIWIYIPLWSGGYSQALVHVANQLGVALTIVPYLVPANAELTGGVTPLGGSFFDIVGGATYSYSLATASSLRISVGVDSGTIDGNRVSTAACGGALLIKATPASDPGAGTQWILGCMRGW